MTDETEAVGLEPEDGSDIAKKRAAPSRSGISFPYAHLEEAVGIARTIAENGKSLSREQIAGVQGIDPGAGGFRLRMAAARTFKLIDEVDDKFQVSDIGYGILSTDETECRQAKREAFLAVPLYQKTFEAFRGKPLPARPLGLENTFVTFGVSPKQKDKARHAFEKSAQFAGFFHAGRERLVEPIINGGSSRGNGVAAVEEKTDRQTIVRPEEIVPSVADPLKEPLVHGLLIRLPPAGAEWPYDKRVRWLKLFASVFDMVYTVPDTEGLNYIDVSKQSI